MSKEVQKSESLPVISDVPDFLRDKMDQCRGSENVTNRDVTIPRLELCQSLSKCRKKNDPQYIEGINEGDLYNSLTRANYGPSILIVPVYFTIEYLLWREQKLGGGFGGAFKTLMEGEKQRKEMEKPVEWEVVETAQHFCLMVSANKKTEQIVVPMSKSKLKVSRNWNAMIRLNGGDRFSRAYSIMGVEEQNTQGQDYYNLNLKNFGFVTEEMYKSAEEMYEAVKAGHITADYSDTGQDEVINEEEEEDLEF